MNYDQMTISEMEEICAKLKEEIEKRRNAEMRGDWKNLVEQIQFFTVRYGPIDIQDKEGKLFYIDSVTDFANLV